MTSLPQYLEAVGVLQTHPNDRDNESLAASTSLGKDNRGWLVIHLGYDFAKYYINLFNFANRFDGIELMRPAWDAHISVVRGEVITDLELWKQMNGKEIGFYYVPYAKTDNRRHYFFTVICQEALDLRELLGLANRSRMA